MMEQRRSRAWLRRTSIIGIAVIGLFFNFLIIQANTDQPVVKENSPKRLDITATPLPEPNQIIKNAFFTFKEMGIEEIYLSFPGNTSMAVDFPDYWQMSTDESYLDLHYDFVANGAGVLNYGVGDHKPPLARVFMNGYLAGEFYPEEGKDKHVKIDIPLLAIAERTTYTSNPSKVLGITITFYDYGNRNCGYYGVLKIYDDSGFNMGFITMPPSRTSWSFPNIILQGSFLPETLLFVLPDNYTDRELTVAAQLAAYIMANGGRDLTYQVVKVADLTDDLLKRSNTIVIGQPGDNKFISDLYRMDKMPSVLLGGKINYLGNPLNNSEGIVQVIPSYENNIYTILIVSGNDEDGVENAAKGIMKPPKATGLSNISFSSASGVPFIPLVETDSDLYIYNAIVFEPPKETEEEAPQSDIGKFRTTFADRFFTTKIFSGYGNNSTGISFYVPRNWTILPGSKLTVHYQYSRNITPINSHFGVTINGDPVENLPIDKVLSDYTTYEIKINPETLIPGTINYINFEASQLNDVACLDIDPNGEWFMIKDDSALQLDYQEKSELDSLNPDNPFDYLANEGNLLVIVPSEPSNEDLNNLLSISGSVGASNAGPADLNIVVRKENKVNIGQFLNFNVLVYGKPSQNQFIKDRNSDLPQKFEDNSDKINPPLANSVHLNSFEDYGIVEVVPLKENPLRGMTILSGTSSGSINSVVKNISKLLGNKSGELFLVNAGGDVFNIQKSDLQAVQKKTKKTLIVPATVIPTATITVRSDIARVIDRDYANNNTGYIYWVIVICVIIIIIGVIQTFRRTR